MSQTNPSFRLQLAASALAPALRDALRVVEDLPSASFADLPCYERDLWLERSLAVVQFFATPDMHVQERMIEPSHQYRETVRQSQSSDYFRVAANLARQQFTPIKGGKS